MLHCDDLYSLANTSDCVNDASITYSSNLFQLSLPLVDLAPRRMKLSLEASDGCLMLVLHAST
jgi:hypothetical protein